MVGKGESPPSPIYTNIYTLCLDRSGDLCIPESMERQDNMNTDIQTELILILCLTVGGCRRTTNVLSRIDG